MDDDEAQSVVEAGQQGFSQRWQAPKHDFHLYKRHQSDDGSCAQRTPKQGAVFFSVFGDVVFARARGIIRHAQRQGVANAAHQVAHAVATRLVGQ